MATVDDFLGTGIVTPFQRGPSDFVSAGGIDHLQSMVSQVLGTRVGELPWRMEFGSKLFLLRHQKNDVIRSELARVYVVEALAIWIPQIRVKNVETSKKKGPPDGRENILLVRVTYDLIGIGRNGNEVLISDIQQSVEVSLAA